MSSESLATVETPWTSDPASGSVMAKQILLLPDKTSWLILFPDVSVDRVTDNAMTVPLLEFQGCELAYEWHSQHLSIFQYFDS